MFTMNDSMVAFDYALTVLFYTLVYKLLSNKPA